jgi:ceramide glucosyltransferase
MTGFVDGQVTFLACMGLACMGFACMGLSAIGVAQSLVASRLVGRFARTPPAPPPDRPPVTVLKPLHGDEPMLEAALTTLCRQHYPAFQILFGVQDAADPAVAVVRRLQARFPALDIVLSVDPTLHGRNRKVGNLINMMALARHAVLVIADADIHVRADYLDRLVAALQQPGVGLVTTLYAGLPRSDAGPPPLPARFGATQITHGFLPGALLARALGRQDCLGATMCLRRDDLDRIGGFPALVDHLADDNVLGRRITAIGLRVALAQTLTLTTVPETTMRALFQHELRWARTIRALEPLGFAASVLQYPLAWGLLAILLSGFALWSIFAFLLAWVLRSAAALGVDTALAALWTREPHGHHDGEATALAFSAPVWLLPVRDVLSVVVMLVSYGGRHVLWRGYGLHADTPRPLKHQPVTHRLSPSEETNAR